MHHEESRYNPFSWLHRITLYWKVLLHQILLLRIHLRQRIHLPLLPHQKKRQDLHRILHHLPGIPHLHRRIPHLPLLRPRIFRLHHHPERRYFPLVLTEKQREDVRFQKAEVIKVGETVAAVKEKDIIFFDKSAAHRIEINKEPYHVISQENVVVVL